MQPRSAWRYALLCASLLLVTIGLHGLAIAGDDVYRRLAENPFEARYDINAWNYFQESPLLALIGYHTGWTSPLAFHTLCLGLVLVGFGAAATWGWLRLGAEQAPLFFLLLVVHPVTLMLLNWLGMPDALTFLFTVVVLFTRSYTLLTAVCLLGLFNHPMMLFIAPVIIGLRLVAGETGLTRWHALAVALGLALGWSLNYLYLALLQIDTFSRLDYALNRDMWVWLQFNLIHLPLSLFSLHNIIWLALGVSLLAAFPYHRAYFGWLLLAQAGFYAITFVTLDTTRVFALLAWAPTLHGVGYALHLTRDRGPERLYRQLRLALLAIGLLGLVMPDYYMWSGELRTPAFNGFYAGLFEWIGTGKLPLQ